MMIDVKNITVSFDESKVLDEVSFEIPEKGTTVVLGKNGSGKSVLLKCLAGLIECQSGEIFIDGKKTGRDLYYSGGDTTVSYVFQKGGLFDSMDLYDNVAFGMRRKKLPEKTINEMVLSSLERVGLGGSEKKLPSELSGGMQKRAGLARAICLRPKVILYDDPTAGLDPVLTDSIADLVIEIKERDSVTSVIVTHDLKFTEKVADSVILLYGGKTVYNGSKNGFFSKENIFAKQFIEADVEGPIDIF